MKPSLYNNIAGNLLPGLWGLMHFSVAVLIFVWVPLSAHAQERNYFSQNQLVKTEEWYQINSPILGVWPYEYSCEVVERPPSASTQNPLHLEECPVDLDNDGELEVAFSLYFTSIQDIGEWTVRCEEPHPYFWVHSICCYDAFNDVFYFPCPNQDIWCISATDCYGRLEDPINFHITVYNMAPNVEIIALSPSRPKWCETVTLHAQSRAGGTPYDPDGGTLDYYWTATRPNGNSMTLNVNAPEVTIPFSSLNDRGLWTIQLRVDDDEGERISLPSYTFHVVGTPPSITLSGNNPKTGDWLQVEAQTVETDTCDEITFNWKIIQAPEPRPDYPPPTYVVGDTWQQAPTVSWQSTSGDMGVWQFQCVGEHKVTGEQGEPRSIYVRVENRPPEIHLTTGGEKIAVDEPIWADGSGSTDPDGGPLTFQWDIIQAPQDAPGIPDDVQAWNGFSTQFRLEIDPHYDNAGTWIFRIIVTDVEGDTNEGEVLYPVLVDAIPTAVISDTNDPYSAMETITLNGGDSIDPDPGPPPCPVAEPNYCHKTIDGRPAKISDGVINYYWELIDVPSELWEEYPTGPVDEVFHVPADSPLLTLEPGTLKTGDWTFALHVWDGEGNTHRTDRTITVVNPSTPPLAILNQWARYTTDINGVLNEDIGLIGTKSFDMDNLLAEDLDWPTPGLGIDYYQWEILQSPSGCNPGSPNWPWPVDPSGEEADTTNLYNAGDNIDPGCQGFWKIGLTVTDDEDMTGSAGTEVIIGNCPQPLCIDSPTNLNPEYVEFTEYTDIFIHYHLDSSLYMETDPNGDMIFAAGMFTMLEIFHQSDPTTPVYTSLDPNVLGSDKGRRLVFQWNGYTNTMQRPQPGRYSIKITLLDYLLGLTNFVATEPDAIWIAVAEPNILPSSDTYIRFDDLDVGSDDVTINYEILGDAVPDKIIFRVLDSSNIAIFEDRIPMASSGTINWDGRIGGVTIAPGTYTAELEAYQLGASLGVSNSHQFFVLKVEFEEIRGLYKDDGTYESGFSGTGRIYCNRIYDPSNLSNTIWTKNKQYIDVKVKIRPDDVQLPADAVILWEVDDPDDNSNEDPAVSPAAERVFDPNDYDGVDNDGDTIADNNDGNDNRGGRDGAPAWEQLHADYALTGNETKIKDGVSMVRFNAQDGGGDNFVIRARLKPDAGLTPWVGIKTGLMTIWKKIYIEYARMKGSGGGAHADPVPIDQINAHYKKSFVEFGILPERLVDPKFVKYKTDPTKDYWAIGTQEDDVTAPDYAPNNLKLHATASGGEFSREDRGWYFMSAAHDWIPISGIKSLVLYPRPEEQNDHSNQLSDWAFGGSEKGTNTDPNYRLYIKLDRPSDVRIRVYKNAALTDLVAEGTGSGGPISLNEKNHSKLYGFVKVAYTADDDDIILTLADQGDATIAGAAGSDEKYQITLDAPLPSGPGIPDLYKIQENFIQLYKPDLSNNIGFILHAPSTSSDRKTVFAVYHLYSPIDNPNSVVKKDLTDHGWAQNDPVKVKILSPGAYGTSGINDYIGIGNNVYFNGRVMFFSGFTNTLGTLLHELGHAVGFAHRCGNRDYKDDKTCFMEYSTDWLLALPHDPDPGARNLSPWTNDDLGLEMCPYHIKGIRETHLEQDSLGRRLGW